MGSQHLAVVMRVNIEYREEEYEEILHTAIGNWKNSRAYLYILTNPEAHLHNDFIVLDD